jgi:hypothetical protein
MRETYILRCLLGRANLSLDQGAQQSRRLLPFTLRREQIEFPKR